MNWKEILLAIAINLDAFSLMTVQGAKLAKVKVWQVMLASVFIATWQLVVLHLTQGIVSYLFGNLSLIHPDSQPVVELLAAFLYLFLGVMMLWRSSKMKDIYEEARDNLSIRSTIEAAITTSIDAGIVGLALALQGIKVNTLSPYIFIFGFLAVVGGIYYGRHYGYDRYNKGLSISGTLFILASMSYYFW